MDIPGIALLLGAVVCILLGLQWGGITQPWGSSNVIGLIVGAAAIAAIFVGTEIFLGERASINMRLLLTRPITFQMIHQICVCSAFFILLYYLPIYFQVVSGTSPAESGVRIIPLIACGSIFAIVSGLIINYTREYQLVILVGNTLLTVGSGLIYTLGVDSNTGSWAGFQVVVGIGLGLSVQVAIIVCQTLVSTADLSTVSAMALFFQLLAGAVFLSVGECVFSNELIESMSRSLGSKRAHQLFSLGQDNLRAHISSPQELNSVIEGHLTGLRGAYTVSIILGGLGTVFSVIGIVVDRRTLRSPAK